MYQFSSNVQLLGHICSAGDADQFVKQLKATSQTKENIKQDTLLLTTRQSSDETPHGTNWAALRTYRRKCTILRNAAQNDWSSMSNTLSDIMAAKEKDLEAIATNVSSQYMSCIYMCPTYVYARSGQVRSGCLVLKAPEIRRTFVELTLKTTT